MNENLNLVEILKDCPKGMPLDCEIFDGTITFSRIVNDEQYPIEIKIDDDYIEYLNKYGCYVDRSFCKCVIFPKGKTTWEGFQRPFVDGDIVINKNNIGTWVGIYHKDDRLNETFSSYCYIRRDGIFCANSENNHGYYETRLATKEEKEKFFQVIKDHGYKWNPKTKTLEKLKEEKFNPKTLKPFESRVLVSTHGKWVPAIFGNYSKEYTFPIVVVGGNVYMKCIPYEGNEHLIDTFDQPSEFYRYWER